MNLDLSQTGSDNGRALSSVVRSIAPVICDLATSVVRGIISLRLMGLATLIPLVVSCAPRAESLLVEKSARIKPGMTRAQVYEVLPPVISPAAPSIASIPVTTFAEMHALGTGGYVPIRYRYTGYHWNRRASPDDVLFGRGSWGAARQSADDVVVSIGKPFLAKESPKDHVFE